MAETGRQHHEGLGAEQAEQEAGIEAVDPQEIARAAAELARESPHKALAGAFAVGFLLGGGLTPRLLASLLLFVGRRYATEMARETVGAAVQQHLDEKAAH